MILPSEKQQRDWELIHDMLDDLCKNPKKIDAVTDLVYQLIWDDK